MQFHNPNHLKDSCFYSTNSINIHHCKCINNSNFCHPNKFYRHRLHLNMQNKLSFYQSCTKKLGTRSIFLMVEGVLQDLSKQLSHHKGSKTKFCQFLALKSSDWNQQFQLFNFLLELNKKEIVALIKQAHKWNRNTNFHVRLSHLELRIVVKS